MGPILGGFKQAANVLYVLREQTLKSALFRLVVKGPLSRVVEQRLRFGDESRTPQPLII